MLTLQEIREQYTSMGQTKEYLSGYIDKIKKILDDNSDSNIIFLGCGSSYSIAKSYAQNTMTSLKRVGLAMAAGDVLIHGDRYRAIFENAIVVAISRSGETTEIIQAVTKMREICKIQVISIVCREDSTASRISDLTLTMPWAFDNSVCQTRTVSCLYFAWLYIAGTLSENQ
ncbi:MAG: SIS domain-containing protein, partial [Lacrimispora sphenoides]